MRDKGPHLRLVAALVAVAASLLTSCAASTQDSSHPFAQAPSISAPYVPVQQSSPPATKNQKPPSHLHQHQPPSAPSGVPRVDMPNTSLTPGVTLPVSVAQVCVSGYASSVRDVSDAEKASVYARYGVQWVPYQHEVDHLISLELGGSNDIRNLWPEPYAGKWGARTKDVLENRLHDMVCAGQISLSAAQHQEATNWVAAYRRYIGSPAGGGGSGPSGNVNSAGGFYASSYPTASTIYCADDPMWHDLSTTYLVHFATFAQAKARFPSYHLHQPC